jgi:deazaflavin-dependent oxidoreductase (nitroreductase family)
VSTPANGTEIQPLITTIGRKTGNPRTVRVRIYYWNGRLIATSPYPQRKRDWVANILVNPEVVITAGDKTIKVKAKLIDRDLPTKTDIAKHRISWRTAHCPAIEPTSSAFIEFFPQEPPEALFDDANVTRSPLRDPLAGRTIDEILDWQKKGNWYSRPPGGLK